jgi:thymidine kinase
MTTNNNDQINKGTLVVRVGPMFSGKTTWLNNELTRSADVRFKVLKIIYSEDNRLDVASTDISGSTHNSSFKHLSDKIDIMRVSCLSEVDVSSYDVIGVDEAQFFTDLYSQIKNWVENKGKHVKVAGLDGDFDKRRFGDVLDLCSLADDFRKLSATCLLCRKDILKSHDEVPAPFTKRLGKSKEQKDIGGSDKYVSVCRHHHN